MGMQGVGMIVELGGIAPNATPWLCHCRDCYILVFMKLFLHLYIHHKKCACLSQILNSHLSHLASKFGKTSF